MAQLFREDGKGLRKGPVGTLYVNVYILRVYKCIYIHISIELQIKELKLWHGFST